jgi:phosphoglycerate dehydrogenase-like enzyme
MLAPFQLKITAMRRQPRGQESVLTVTPDHVAGALATADHVIDILPDNASSYRFMNQERFAQMKPGAAFYNIGRGTTVDQIALAENLRSGHLAAAWLDVTDPEPLPENDPLWTTPNCHITPHTAGSHDHASASLVRHFLQNFQLFLQSSPLHDRVI